MGNISTISKNGNLVESYTYDYLNQLKTVTNSDGTYTYEYDDGGNILSVTLNGAEIKDYTYSTGEWKDLLTAYNEQSITYDTIGNPLNYYDGSVFTWSQGRKLTGITKGTDSIAYTYNADGLRTSKTVNGTTTEYYWLNGILQGQKTGSEYILFLHDENGTAYGFLIKNGEAVTYYYYLFNAQGDVIGILDNSGTKVVEYTYDVWGKLLSVTGTLANTIGQTNPIRYRGYYYDGETSFYYLQSRYYDAEIGRFLNADGLLSTGQGILGYNMFAYCNNNPVMYCDTYGANPIGAILGGLVKAVMVTIATVSIVMAINTLTPQGRKANSDFAKAIDIAFSDTIAAVGTLTRNFVSDYNIDKSNSRTKEKDVVVSKPKTQQTNYWAADLIFNQVVVSTPLTVQEASFRVATGRNIMCRNETAARHILFINGYMHPVGPERGIGEGFYSHYHPTRNHTGYNSIHIWFYD